MAKNASTSFYKSQSYWRRRFEQEQHDRLRNAPPAYTSDRESGRWLRHGEADSSDR